MVTVGLRVAGLERLGLALILAASFGCHFTLRAILNNKPFICTGVINVKMC